MTKTYFNCHSHTMYSNIRLLDSINRPEDLIQTALDLGLSGIAITDHECLSAAVVVNKIAEQLQKTNPDFTIALGNEIYLTEDRSFGQKYYHFLLIAKDEIGHKALRELSSKAWYNSYVDHMTRVPTLKSELKEVVNKYKGHLIATTACIGGELSTNALQMVRCMAVNDQANASIAYQKITDFIDFCLDLFGEDFYIECAPSTQQDQIDVNKKLRGIAEYYGIKMTIGTDAHYLRKKDRWVHKAYLTSKESNDREVDDFYEFTYVMSPDECRELMKHSFDDEFIDTLYENSQELQNKIKFFSLQRNQDVTRIDVKDYPKNDKFLENLKGDYKILKSLANSDDIQERYWVNQCIEALEDKKIGLKKEYLDRLEEEADIKRTVGEKLNTCMFAYPNTLQHYIDLFWECGSTVGAGRGSACSGLNHYLLGITQLDPIQWKLPFWRYLNKERVELGDIDLDLAPSKLDNIFNAIRKERGELGIVQVSTFGTETTKSAILTACRGYRSADHPDGIDVDQAQYLSSLVPQERGFLWPVSDLINGNPEKGRLPSKTFLQAAEKFPGLLDIIKGIEGLVCRRGSHASGVILFDEDLYEKSAIMRTPSGAIVTQWDLHDAEYMGNVKYDFLLTTVQDKIIKTIEFLQEDGLIEKDLSLREIYNKYLHPAVLPTNDKRMWDALAAGEVISCFQFDSDVGQQAAAKIKPKSPLELADANGLMRLMTAEKGAETPLDKYVRFKNNISLWYEEMRQAGLSPSEQKTLEPYFLDSYGVPPSQEQMMKMLMDENICGFSLADANAARKIVGKKQMNKIPALHEQVIKQARSSALGQYVWSCGIGPQMGYSFSIIHALAYSFIGMQTLYLATNFNPIYWNTACLVVDSGSLEDASEEEIVGIYEPEADDLSQGVTFEDLPDRKGKIRKTSSTDYTKLAKAIGAIRSAGIEVSLVDINKSDFGFKPDAENNRILFGMKGLLNVGDDLINLTIKLRPFASPKDYLLKVKPKRQSMISLIKAGAFDGMMDRKLCMGWYIWETCDKKSRLTLQNMSGLLKYNLIPDENGLELSKKVFEFNRYLKAVCKNKKDINQYFIDERATAFLVKIGKDNLITQDSMNNFVISAKSWDNVYQSYMDTVRTWLNKNKDNLLFELNKLIFKDDWNKYALGTLSAWEMEVLCFYYHEHELANLNMSKYDLTNFKDIPENPEVESSFFKNGYEIKKFKLYRICGTCIAKNKTKGIVSLLTTDGVVDVKFRKEYFALFDKQISEKGADGVKHRVESSWFNRGNMIIVNGMRDGDSFFVKKYNSTQGHQLYKITKVFENGDIAIQTERYNGGGDDI